MQKTSFLFLLILAGVALIGAYHALFPLLPVATIFGRFFALSALFILCVSLIIGPLAAINSKYASLIEPRRAVGIAAFVFVAIHVLLELDFAFGFNFSAVLGYFPMQLAVPATVILLAMALTSSDWAVKKMGMGKWKTLQMFVYPAFLLIMGHFVLSANGLFVKTQAGTFVNLAESAVLTLSGVTIVMQIYGVYIRKKRASNAGRAAGASDAAGAAELPQAPDAMGTGDAAGAPDTAGAGP